MRRRGRKEAKPLSIGFPVGYIHHRYLHHHHQHPQLSRWSAERGEGGREGDSRDLNNSDEISLSLSSNHKYDAQ